MCNEEQISSYMHVMQRRFSSKIMHGFENYSDLQKIPISQSQIFKFDFGRSVFFYAKTFGGFLRR